MIANGPSVASPLQPAVSKGETKVPAPHALAASLCSSPDSLTPSAATKSADSSLFVSDRIRGRSSCPCHTRLVCPCLVVSTPGHTLPLLTGLHDETMELPFDCLMKIILAALLCLNRLGHLARPPSSFSFLPPSLYHILIVSLVFPCLPG